MSDLDVHAVIPADVSGVDATTTVRGLALPTGAKSWFVTTARRALRVGVDCPTCLVLLPGAEAAS